MTRRPLAEADILEIWDYIADDSVAAADRWLDELDAKFNLLATQPMMGRVRDELEPGMRSFPFGRYVIFYMPIDEGIDVVRVLHGARDIDAVFTSEWRQTFYPSGVFGATGRGVGNVAVS
jgi:toxin ParE1/3/4